MGEHEAQFSAISENIIRIATVDVGYSNFAQYVEDSSIEKIKELKDRFNQLPKGKRRTTGGPMNDEVLNILQELTNDGERIQVGVYKFSEENGEGLTDNVRRALLDHLRHFQVIWDTCDSFVIEQQFFKAPPKGRNPKQRKAEANIQAIRIGEIVYTWFFDNYPFKTVKYFGSKYKTQIFGAPYKMTKPQRKVWSTIKAHEIFTEREDQDMMNVYELSEAVKRKRNNTEDKIQKFHNEYPCDDEYAWGIADNVIRNKQKLDDVSDCVVMLQAF